MEILAHRTAMANAPPNSLKGLKYCFVREVKVVECDISFTKDRKAIIWAECMDGLVHNKNSLALEKSKPISQFHLKDLGWGVTIRADCNEPVLDVIDIFAFLNVYPRIKVIFDIKYLKESFWELITHIRYHYQKMPEHFIGLVEREILRPAMVYGLEDRIGFVTFCGGVDLLRFVKRKYPKVMTSLLVVFPWTVPEIGYYLDHVDSVTIGWEWLNHWQFFPGRIERLVEEVHRRGRKVWGGLTRNKSDVNWLSYHRFDGVWADDIDMVREVLSSEI